MQVWRAAVTAIVGADAVERVWAAQHILDDAPPVQRLLFPVHFAEASVDGAPAGRGVADSTLEPFVFSNIHPCALLLPKFCTRPRRGSDPGESSMGSGPWCSYRLADTLLPETYLIASSA
jgi:hypothetical protein